MTTVTNSIATNMAEPIPALDLKAQYVSIREEILAATEAVLDGQHFILGPEVKKFEGEIAAYLRCGFGLGVASGTDALILGLKACNIGPGDEVICPSFTFIATADAVSMLGATPVFVDIDPHTFTIDPSKIEERVTPSTKAIIVVHLYGQAADMDPIFEIARRRNLRVIEDTAQALGATYKGRKVASLGDIGCLSFFPSKNLGGCGDGGMIVTNSEALAKRVQSLRSHGAVKKYFSEEQGWNSRLDEIQAAILRVKLRYLEQWSAARREKAARYDALLKNIPGLKTPRIAPWGEHVFHQYTIRVPKRDQVQKFLADRGIASTLYYPTPIHLQPIYKNLGHRLGDFPETESAASEALSLPIYPELTEAQMQRVADALVEACSTAV
jgi:dTDP-4-amino-4,6-dideoxygalactose transaminase